MCCREAGLAIAGLCRAAYEDILGICRHMLNRNCCIAAQAMLLPGAQCMSTAQGKGMHTTVYSALFCPHGRTWYLGLIILSFAGRLIHSWKPHSLQGRDKHKMGRLNQTTDKQFAELFTAAGRLIHSWKPHNLQGRETVEQFRLNQTPDKQAAVGWTALLDAATALTRTPPACWQARQCDCTLHAAAGCTRH